MQLGSQLINLTTPIYQKEIQKEMGAVKVAFKILGENEKPQLPPSI